MQRFKHLFKWGLAVLFIAAVILIAARVRRGQTQATSYTQVVTVERGNLVATIKPTGEVTARYQAKLSFDANGVTLIVLNVAPGQQVQKGQVLARIDPSSLQRAVDQAEADLLSAEEALEKAKNPYTDLDRKKAELDVALAEAALLEAKQASAAKTIQEAERALQQAKDKLVALQNDLSTKEQIDRLQWLANIAEVEHGKLLEGPIVTEEARDREVLAYNRMMDAKDNLESAKARAALDLLNAQNQVIQAEKNLAQLKAGLAEAQVRNKIAQAEYNLAKAKDT
ncbi:MAG: biotin/lipoyl-binding protein, partial [Chloroflexi bacterium]|nr:biotin/lipoyl-binding protein [Chloroflexota bacterium]